ncbi:MAG: phosphate acetyltransferase [Clostridia bacterium]
MFFKRKAVTKTIFDNFISLASESNAKIVLPEGNDNRILDATEKSVRLGLSGLILIGNDSLISSKLSPYVRKRIEVVDPLMLGSLAEKYADDYFLLRKHKGITPEDARKKIKDPVTLGALMVKMDDADGMVAGIITHTADVLRPAFQLIKTRDGVSVASSVMLMEMPEGSENGQNGVMVFADCGVIIKPTDEELATIALCSAETAQTLCDITPRVALLSYSSKADIDTDDEDIQRIKSAYKIIRRRDSSLIVDGEIQVDVALDNEVAKIKCKNSPLEGKANVLIFPDLNAGNIGYKLVQRIANVKAIGPIIQGLNKPVNDLSRGATPDEIVIMIAITKLQAKVK